MTMLRDQLAEKMAAVALDAPLASDFDVAAIVAARAIQDANRWRMACLILFGVVSGLLIALLWRA